MLIGSATGNRLTAQPHVAQVELVLKHSPDTTTFMNVASDCNGSSFDPNGVEERLNALWKVVTEMVEQFNKIRCTYKRDKKNWDRLQGEMMEALCDVHARIDKLRPPAGDDGPQDTDKAETVGFLDTLD